MMRHVWSECVLIFALTWLGYEHLEKAKCSYLCQCHFTHYSRSDHVSAGGDHRPRGGRGGGRAHPGDQAHAAGVVCHCGPGGCHLRPDFLH